MLTLCRESLAFMYVVYMLVPAPSPQCTHSSGSDSSIIVVVVVGPFSRCHRWIFFIVLHLDNPFQSKSKARGTFFFSLKYFPNLTYYYTIAVTINSSVKV